MAAIGVCVHCDTPLSPSDGPLLEGPDQERPTNLDGDLDRGAQQGGGEVLERNLHPNRIFSFITAVAGV